MAELDQRWFLWTAIVEMMHVIVLLLTGYSRYGAVILGLSSLIYIFGWQWESQVINGHQISWWHIGGVATILLPFGILISFLEWGLISSPEYVLVFTMGLASIAIVGIDLLLGGQYVHPDLSDSSDP